MRLGSKWKTKLHELRYTGVTYYLNTASGSDSNDGLSTSTPFLTREYAESIMVNGDVLFLTSIGEGQYPHSSNLSDFTTYSLRGILYRNTVNAYDLSPSRASGVAPLSVHFYVDLPASTPSSRPFHDYLYIWNFGDTGAGTWGTNGKSKNSARGPVTTHIFETPGTYTVALTVKGENGTVIGMGSTSITVTDPDTVYSGTNTTCVNVAGDTDFTGKPTGAREVSTDDLTTITQYATAGSRILFKRGGSWVSTGTTFPDNAGPVTLGAYGTGTSPDALGIYSNAPLITLSTGNFCDLSDKQNWRIMDLHLVNSGNAGSFGGLTSMQRILFQQLKISGFNTAIGWTHWNETTSILLDQMVISECDLSDSFSITVYVGCERLALLGNIVKDSVETHVIRVWQSYLGVISHNISSGASLDTTDGRHALKFHGPGIEENYPPEPSTSYLEHRTSFTVISDNIFGSSGPWPVDIGPADGGHNCYITDIIFEGNRIIPDYGSQTFNTVQIALLLWASYCTARNNIIEGTGGFNGFTGINISRRGIEPLPTGNEIYNNTIYRQDEEGLTNAHVGIFISSDASDTIVKNNFARFPVIAGNAMIDNDSADLEQSNNTLITNPNLVDPDNVDPLSRDFHPNVGSSAIDAGTTVPVYEDFEGNVRPDGDYDSGAYET
jgi:PKD repeat protein